MPWLKDAKNFDLDRIQDNAERRFNRWMDRCSNEWSAFEETGSTRELARWDGYAERAQLAAGAIARVEALKRIANNG